MNEAIGALDAIKEVYDFLKKTGTYYLATVENGAPRVRPFGTVDIFGGKLNIQTGLKKPVAKQMLADPRVEICAFDGERWLRLSAKAVLEEDIEAARHMLDAYPELKGMYQPGDGNAAVFSLTEATASFCSFTKPPKTLKF